MATDTSTNSAHSIRTIQYSAKAGPPLSASMLLFLVLLLPNTTINVAMSTFRYIATAHQHLKTDILLILLLLPLLLFPLISPLLVQNESQQAIDVLVVELAQILILVGGV